MKNANTILSLESIPAPTIYSKYGESLNKLFKSRSLKNLISELKNPKKFIPKDKQNENQKKIKYNEEEHKDIFSSFENNLNKDEENKNDFKKKSIDVNKYYHRKLNNKIELMDPFKYNPNYNSVSKNIPSVKMILTEKEIKELQMIKERQKSTKGRKKPNMEIKKVIPKIKTRNEESFITLLTENNKKISIKNSSSNQEHTLPPILKVPEQKERAVTLENNYNFKNNHALRFSKYIPRKFEFNNKDNINKISYLEPYDYLNHKNNIVDFRKMAYRKENDLINSSSLGVPSFNIYNPKYNLIDKKTSEVVFSPHLNKKSSKKYLLKKLWSSYEVLPEYLLVNNNQLLKK